jgi:hypothetical protein
MPELVVDKYNSLILDALSDHGLPASSAPLTPAFKPHIQRAIDSISGNAGDHLMPVFWRIDSALSWQQIDRRIDGFATKDLC